MNAERMSTMQRFFGSLRTARQMAVLLSVVALFIYSALPARAVSMKATVTTPTLVVNANQVLHSVTHVASGGLYGLGSDTTPDDSMVIPLHPKVFTQMAPNGHQLPNGEATPGGD